MCASLHEAVGLNKNAQKKFSLFLSKRSHGTSVPYSFPSVEPRPASHATVFALSFRFPLYQRVPHLRFPGFTWNSTWVENSKWKQNIYLRKPQCKRKNFLKKNWFLSAGFPKLQVHPNKYKKLFLSHEKVEALQGGCKGCNIKSASVVLEIWGVFHIK